MPTCCACGARTPVFSRQAADQLDGASLSPDCLVVRFFSDAGSDRLLFANFGRDLAVSPVPQPLLAPPPDCRWELLWSSDSAQYGGRGTVPPEIAGGWRIPGEAAVVMKAVAHSAAGRPNLSERPRS